MVTVNFTGNSVVTNFREDIRNKAESSYKVTYHCANYPITNTVLAQDNVGVVSGGADDGMRIYRNQLTHEQLVAGGVTRRFNVDLITIDANGVPSVPYTVEAYNPPPAAPASLISSSHEWALLTLSPATDEDFVGYKVWASETTPVVKNDTNLVYSGPNSQITFAVEGATTYYVRFYGYDAFGEDDATETEISFTTPDAPTFDTIPPAQPTGLTGTGTLIQQGSSEQLAQLTFEWNRNSEADMAYYTIAIQEGSGNFVLANVGQSPSGDKPRYSFIGKKGVIYTGKVLAVDTAGNKSNYSGAYAIANVIDTTPPAAPTSLLAVAAVQNIFVTWLNASDSDLSGVEVWANSVNNSLTATKIFTVRAIPNQSGSYTHSGLTTGTTRYYWLKSVDTSGNASDFSTGVNATTISVANADIVAGSITGDKITASTIAGDRFITNTSLPGTITVGTTGVQIGTVQSQAANPAAQINTQSTLITPGKIQLIGSTSLSNWLYGGDQTLIDGGKIAANTIQANQIFVGSTGLANISRTFRNVEVVGTRAANDDAWDASGYDPYGLIPALYFGNPGIIVNRDEGGGYTSGGGYYQQIGRDPDVTDLATQFLANITYPTYSFTIGGQDARRYYHAGAKVSSSRTFSVDLATTSLDLNLLSNGTSGAMLMMLDPTLTTSDWDAIKAYYVAKGVTAWSTLDMNKVYPNPDWPTTPVGSRPARSRVYFWIDDSGVLFTSFLSSWTSGGITYKGYNDLILDTHVAYMGYWESGTSIVQFGPSQTIIDGNSIQTNTLKADKIQADSIWTRNLFVGGEQFRLDGNYGGAGQGTLVIKNTAMSQDLVKVGWLTASEWGIQIKDNAGNTVMKSSASGGTGSTTISGTYIDSLDANKINATSLSAITATIGTLRTATSGQRTEIRDNKIQVYDSSNVERVRIGDLS